MTESTSGNPLPPPGEPSMEERGQARRRLRRRVGVLGCGCFLVVAITAMWLGWVFYRGVQNLAADFADPEARTRKVLRELGAETLPPGYYAAMTVDVPLPFDMVILSDQPWDLPQDEELEKPIYGVPGTKLFYYIHIQAEDRSGQDPFARELTADRKLGQGDLFLDDRLVAWEAHAGRLNRPGDPADGIFVRLRIDCGDAETRRGVWFHQKESVSAESSAEELAGSPADPEAITEFLGYFNLCGVPVAEPAPEAPAAKELESP